MKRIVLFSLLVVAFCGLVGCSSTRKAIKATSTIDSQVTAQQVQTDERQSEERKTATAATTSKVTDLSNVVIEFTKVEYADGYEVQDSDSTPSGTSGQGNPATRKREGKSKPPNGVKSVTKGRITINNDRNETTLTSQEEATERQEQQSGSIKAQSDSKQKTTTSEKTKVEKPGVKAVVIEFAVLCLLLALALLLLRYQVRKHNKQGSNG